jgi:hypothetical protein
MAQQVAGDLSRYAGRDLRKLTTNEAALFRSEVTAKTGVKLGEYSMQPWLLARFDQAGVAWVLIEGYPGYAIPDVSGVTLHFFDKSWTQICNETFPTGYRFFLNQVTVQRGANLNCPLIVAKATCSGPFITSPGPKRPAFEQGDFQRQYYALSGTNVLLVRLEDDNGKLVRNSYGWSAPMKGPRVPTRTKAEWLEWLGSSNAVQKLYVLVWLTGGHLSSQGGRMTDHNQESVQDSKMYEAVRDDPQLTSILKRLLGDSQPWVRDYAGLMKE